MAIPKLIPGFRFHPTGVELIKYFLKRKVMGKKFHTDVIAELDIYKYAPWDLPDMSYLKNGDLEWYFFCPIGKKYGSGARLNRATEIGFWKATGKDRAVQHNSHTVGMIKTLVFHTGKAPRGDRTDWVMHEYRLEDKDLADKGIVQDSYVICRVFQKEGPGPKNGAQYGRPFIEEDWSDDEVGIPFVESNGLVPSLPVTTVSYVMNDRNLQASRCSGSISMPCQSGLMPSPIPVSSCQTGLIPSPDPASSCQTGLMPSPDPASSCQTGLMPSDPVSSCQTGLMPSPDPVSSCQTGLMPSPDPVSSCQTGLMPSPDPANPCQTELMPSPNLAISCLTGLMLSPIPANSCQTLSMPSLDPVNSCQTRSMPTPDPVNSCQTGSMPTPDPVNSCQTGSMPTPDPMNSCQIGSMPTLDPMNLCQTGSMPTPDPVNSCQTGLTPSFDPATHPYPDNQAISNDDDILSMLDIFKDYNTFPEENIAEGAPMSDFFEGLGDLDCSAAFGSFYQNADFSTDGMSLIDLDSELFWQSTAQPERWSSNK
ncbi:NAC domain-containing protein 82 isoform X2 [Lathyrus oleraceus]|uniref:NAC domain-containing protein 82 isoform X2 n=1 Tax=Pisum sativum TaxID=3888 RepID=UPI0021D32379|nr:NAC domain-containing protein 82-like isoform X2 [Pisum sativum]